MWGVLSHLFGGKVWPRVEVAGVDDVGPRGEDRGKQCSMVEGNTVLEKRYFAGHGIDCMGSCWEPDVLKRFGGHVSGTRDERWA